MADDGWGRLHNVRKWEQWNAMGDERVKAMWPVCALCNSPVDEMRRTDDFERGVVFMVKCHGDEETTTVTHWDLCNMSGPDALHGGYAFTARRLTNG